MRANSMSRKDGGPVRIKKDEKNPEADEVIARSIIEISDGMKKILSGSLKLRTIVILIAHETKLPQREVQRVLEAAADLKRLYCK